MTYSGAWRAANVTPLDYAGAAKWGTGVNPIHAVPEGIPRGDIKLPLGQTGTGGAAPEVVLGPIEWGYQAEDAQFYTGEDYRYLREDHPNLGDNTGARPDRDGQIMEVGAYPQPEGWPSWGPANLDGTSDDFPLTGPPAGAGVRSYSDQLEIERGRLIAVPTPGYTGGWQSKLHGNVNEARTSDPSQYEIATGLRQTVSQLDNNRAVTRATDAPRSPMHNRLTGVKVKSYAKSLGMGGGPGTPDMYPQQQDGVPKRPFFYRTGATPPAEPHTWNEITYFDPVMRVVPDDPGALVTTQSNAGSGGPDYGYTSEEGSWY